MDADRTEKENNDGAREFHSGIKIFVIDFESIRDPRFF